MNITSNLTTINIDGENSSSDGMAYNVETDQPKSTDLKCLNQFRRR